MNGILNVYKERGYTSFDVVAVLRRILKIKKIGHTGTLDPDAEGVLPVCVGNATRLSEFLTDKTKVYETVLLLGKITDTQDISGTVLEERAATVCKEQVMEIIHLFLGKQEQIPPMYSAIKVGGKKLYELAREGIEIERAKRSITVYSIEIISMNENQGIIKEIALRIACSKGTYIRTLCHDIGQALGCGGVMKSLVRIQSGDFFLSESRKLSEIEQFAKEGRIRELMLPTDQVFSYPKLKVKEEYSKLLRNGNLLKADEVEYWTEDGKVPETSSEASFLVYDSDETFAGIYFFNTMKGCYQPVKMFLA